MTKTTVRIPVGLPASGKTGFYQSLKENCIEIIGEERSQYPVYPKSRRLKTIDDYTEIIRNYNGFHGILCIDGLFWNTDMLDSLLTEVKRYLNPDNIIVDVWEENRESCIRNDYLRRPINSEATIRSLIIDVNYSYLKEKYGIKIERHVVYRVPDYVMFFRQYGLDLKTKYYDSDSWVCGGVVQSFNGDWGPIDAEAPKTSFSEVYDMLCEINSEISISRISFIESCITIEERIDNDYYSRTQSQFFRCDMEKLYNGLIEFGYISESWMNNEEQIQYIDKIRANKLLMNILPILSEEIINSLGLTEHERKIFGV